MKKLINKHTTTFKPATKGDGLLSASDPWNDENLKKMCKCGNDFGEHSGLTCPIPVKKDHDTATKILSILNTQRFADFYNGKFVEYIEDETPENKAEVLNNINVLFGRLLK